MSLLPWYGWLYVLVINFLGLRVVGQSLAEREIIYSFLESLFFVSLLLIAYSFWVESVMAVLEPYYLYIAGYALFYTFHEFITYAYQILSALRAKYVRSKGAEGGTSGVQTSVMEGSQDFVFYFTLILPSVLMAVLVVGRMLNYI